MASGQFIFLYVTSDLGFQTVHNTPSFYLVTRTATARHLWLLSVAVADECKSAVASVVWSPHRYLPPHAKSDLEFQTVYNTSFFFLAPVAATPGTPVPIPCSGQQVQERIVISGLVTFFVTYHHVRIFKNTVPFRVGARAPSFRRQRNLALEPWVPPPLLHLGGQLPLRQED